MTKYPARIRGLRSEAVLRALSPEMLTMREFEKLWHLDYWRATQSRRWRSLRQRAIAERGSRCARCNQVAEAPHLHHLTYERLGREEIEDVELLCPRCHYHVHHGGEFESDLAGAGAASSVGDDP